MMILQRETGRGPGLLRHGCALLRRDESRRVGQREPVVLLPGFGEEIVAGADLDAADPDEPVEDDHFLGAFVRVPWKARALAKPHHRRPAAGLVVPKQAAL